MCTSRGLSVTLFGPDIDHRRSLEAMLTDWGAQVTWLPDSISFLANESYTLRHRVQRAVNQLTYTRDSAFLGQTLQHLDENHTEVIIAYWGTRPLADIVAVKRLRPHIKIALMVLCFPLAFDSLGVMRQIMLMRRAAEYLDGVLYPNTAMQEYFQQKVWGRRGKHLKESILSPCWPGIWQREGEESEPNCDHPNLIFVGRTDLSSRTIQIADDLRLLMAEILENQIELHHVRSPETADGHPYRCLFEPLDQPGLIAKMGVHDASLIAYNADACRRKERLELTVPDRLLTSVAAGVPIAIPSRGYCGAKQYLAHYPAVLEFDSIAGLKRQLADRARVQALRAAAWQARKLYTAETQGDILARFLTSMGVAAPHRPERLQLAL